MSDGFDPGEAGSGNDSVYNDITQSINYNDYLASGGNPSLAVQQGNLFYQAGSPGGLNPYDPTGGLGYGGGGGYRTASYAPYDEGGGHTKWDEFVQQMAYNNAKLAQDKALQEETLAQQKEIEDARIAEQKYAAQQGAVTDFDKQLMSEQGPKDPYGYLFNSRGLATPQGYAPTQLPLSDAVRQAYSDEGVNLQDAQNYLTGKGPSFINGYLGSMAPEAQQGPMGFQNAPGAQQSSNTDNQQAPTGAATQPPPPPAHAAQGLMVPGYAPGHDTVPAMLSPGEGVLKPQVVQQMGGPKAIDALNAQHFADGGIVTPTAVPQYTTTQQPVYSDPYSYQQLVSGGAPGSAAQYYTVRGGDTLSGIANRQGKSLADVEAMNQYLAGRSGGGLSGFNYIRPGDQIEIAPGSAGSAPVYQTVDVPAKQIGTKDVQTQTGTNYQIAGQNVGQNSWENAAPQGYTMNTPGVATRDKPVQQGPTGIANFPSGDIDTGVMQGIMNRPRPIWGPTGIANFGGGGHPMIDPMQGGGNDWISAIEQHFGHGGPTGIASFGGGGRPMVDPFRPLGPITANPPTMGGGTANPVGGGFQPPTPVGSNPAANPNSPLLTGGVLTPPAPAGQAPINLNTLDPYTRSLVDQYGRPQTPSAQAWNDMPQSGKDAYTNYVEKVAGGNMQDLLDQQKATAPQGDAAALRDTMGFNS